MRVLIVGGAGFVGLNIANHLAECGCAVSVLDRAEPASFQRAALGARAHKVTFLIGDVTTPETIVPAITPSLDAVIYGAAITADAARDATEPEHVLAVNLGGIIPVLRAAKSCAVRRVINLSSATAVGRASCGVAPILESSLPDPTTLYAITKMATERVCERLAELWDMDIVSLRLSAVFGPFECATGVRDTLSPLGQIMMAATRGQPALLPRAGNRDWVYARDVAAAVKCVIDAPTLAHRLYNVTSGSVWSALDWGQNLARMRPGFECRLTSGNEIPTIDLFAPTDRAPLAGNRLANELGWTARFGSAESLADFDAWSRVWGTSFWGTANGKS